MYAFYWTKFFPLIDASEHISLWTGRYFFILFYFSIRFVYVPWFSQKFHIWKDGPSPKSVKPRLSSQTIFEDNTLYVFWFGTSQENPTISFSQMSQSFDPSTPHKLKIVRILSIKIKLPTTQTCNPFSHFYQRTNLRCNCKYPLLYNCQ